MFTDKYNGTMNREIINPAFLAGMFLATISSAQSQKMNVVFLLADDLRWNSVNCMGNSMLVTPNLDRLAEDGIRFSNARVTTAICMVSRASLLTGQYMSRHQITKFGVQLPEKVLDETYPALLRKAGYHTGYVGKYGVGKIKADQFDYSVEYEGKHWLPDGKGDSIQVTSKNEKDALFFLKNRPKDKPFLLSVGFFATHAEDMHPDQYRYRPESEKYYRDAVIPLSKTATEQALRALPPFISDEKNEGRNRWHWRFDTPEKYQRYMKAYYRMLTELDEAAGNIIKELKAQGVYENTLIIFMGDNGYFHSDHMLADKWYPYEEALRVPLIVHDPRLPVSKRNGANAEFVLNIDITPFILKAAGVGIPTAVQGRDFSGLYLFGESTGWRKDFYYEHPTINNKTFIPSSEALVTHHEKYINWPEYQYEEYFNLRRDPNEVKNGIREKKNQSSIMRLKKRLEELKSQAR